MKAKLLTLAALAAMLVGGLAMPSSADARPGRGYGYFGPYNQTYYYGRGPVPYYRTYPGYQYGYWQRPYGYYNNVGPGYYGPRGAYYGPRAGFYIGAQPGVYLRF